MTKARLEVEAKARVSGPEEVSAKLEKMGRELAPIDFEDAYYVPGEVEGYSHHRFRVRRSGDRTLVTAKEPAGPDGGASREWEFEVSDAERFLGFLSRFGFKPLLTKRKRGRRFAVAAEAGEATVEVVEIAGLGWFVEIEIMVDVEEEVAMARATVEGLFHRLGISRHELEPTPYTLMLYHLKNRK